ncbi:hypothetical protein GDO81_027867 [Engystomops pustulosus]|uniref:Uncharacterized protein n=1 Tax=Engystomops pustulosus TaxID=76066 RepID=A0AAV6ZJX1_ENGPU|nr:hypothetical protein GDO81_027867 [Engystomops pustulosus]
MSLHRLAGKTASGKTCTTHRSKSQVLGSHILTQLGSLKHSVGCLWMAASLRHQVLHPSTSSNLRVFSL